MKITLMDDEFSLRNNIKEFLELNHYIVEAYSDGNSLLEKTNFDSDLYILDINVPGADGYEVIEWVSSNSPNTPVLFITAFTDIESITKGYALGCRDYLKKPFNLKELHLRIINILKDNQVGIINITPEFKFDIDSKQLLKKDKFIKISKTQKNILYTLIQFKNKVVDYTMLIDNVWDGKFIKHNTIASHIREIRHIIPDINIESIRAEGYILKL